jgi:hypothetical protein
VEPGRSAVLTFSYSIQRAQASAFGRVQGTQLSSTFEPGTMTTSSVPPSAPVALPPLVAAYVEATNNFDLEGLIALSPRTRSSMTSYGTTGESRPSESGRYAISLVKD